MLVLTTILALLLGAFIGKILFRISHFLPLILLEPAEENEEVARVSRELFRRVFSLKTCAKCDKSTSFLDSLPILGEILSKGKCPDCSYKTGSKPLVIEIVMTVLVGLAAAGSASGAEFILTTLISSLLVLCFTTDFQYKIIPDQFTIPLLWIGLVGSTFFIFTSPTQSIIGAALGYALFWGLNEVFRYVRHQEGMYPGDFKFNAALGACFGFFTLIPIIFIALALIIAATILKFFYRERSLLFVLVKEEVAFGCYISVVALATLYLKLFEWIE